MQKVIEGLYISSVFEASKKESLLANKITHIVIVASYLDACFPKDFIYLRVPVEDNETVDIKCYFEDAIKFIAKARASKGNVLVHCAAGISRSSTIVTAYLMWELKLGVNNAFVLLKKAYSQAWPNDGFYIQLQEFESELQLTSTIPKPGFFMY